MNMETFYEEMKAALDFFGLRFSDMGAVTVHFVVHTKGVRFTYKNLSAEIRDIDEVTA